MSALHCVLSLRSDERHAAALAHRMAAAIPFRGTSEFATRPRFALAIQQHHGESQLHREDRRLVAIDGYIANWREAAPDISGANDAERIARLLARQSTAALARLDGEFALIVVDDEGARIHSSPSSTRALYLRRLNDAICIATDMGALQAAAEDSPRVDHQALSEYLLFHRSMSRAETTYFRDIERLRPGELLQITGDAPSWSRRALWRPPDMEELAPTSRNMADRAAELRETIATATRASLPDADSALSLSGGLDSGSLWGMGRKLAEDGYRPAARLEAFSQTFPGLPCDESDVLDAQERFHRHPITRLDVSRHRNAELLPLLNRRLDYVIAPNAYYYEPFYRLIVEQGRHVVLLGIGGDEWLEPSLFHLGDEWHAGRRLHAFLTAMHGNRWTRQRGPRASLRRAFRLTIARQGSPLRRIYNQWIRRPPEWLHPRRHGLYHQLLDEQEQRCFECGVHRCRLLATLDWFASYGLAPNQQFAASHGLDIRHPLMLGHVIEFGFRTPAALLAGPANEPKALLRQAMRDLLPSRLREQPSKPTFDIPGVNDPRLLSLAPPPRHWRLVEADIVAAEWLQRQLQSPQRNELPPVLTNLVTAELFLEKWQ